MKHKTDDVKEVKEPKKAMRPPMGGKGGMGVMLSQLKLHHQGGKSTVINISCYCNGIQTSFNIR